MGLLTLTAALCLVASSSHQVLASPTAAPDPLITPPALLPRDITKTLGWYAESGATAATVSFSPWWYDADSFTFSSSGSFIRRCPVSSSCTMFTSCSSGWMIGAGASSFCGFSTMSNTASHASYCSNHVLLPSLGATTGGLKWFWCDVAPLTGYSIYIKQPNVASATTTQSSSNSNFKSTDASTTRASGSSPTNTNTNTASTSNTATPTPLPDQQQKSSTPVGAIVGGVVAGIAILGAVIFAIFFIMRRDKQKKAAAQGAYQATPLMGGTGGAGSTAYQGGGGSGYASQEFYASEQKPQAQPNYYPQSYPMGPYDPHLGQGQYYPGAAAPHPHGQQPVQFAPQELPAGPQ